MLVYTDYSWDSANPKKNPPPMPVPGSFEGGSPIRQQPFASRSTTVTVNDEKIGEILKIAESISKNQDTVKDSITEALVEFGNLAYRSKDNANALIALQSIASRTEKNSLVTKEAIEESALQIRNSLDGFSEMQQLLFHTDKYIRDSNNKVLRELAILDIEGIHKKLDRSLDKLEFTKIIQTIISKSDNLLLQFNELSNAVEQKDLSKAAKEPDDLSGELNKQNTFLDNLVDHKLKPIFDTMEMYRSDISTLGKAIDRLNLGDKDSSKANEKLLQEIKQSGENLKTHATERHMGVKCILDELKDSQPTQFRVQHETQALVRAIKELNIGFKDDLKKVLQRVEDNFSMTGELSTYLKSIQRFDSIIESQKESIDSIKEVRSETCEMKALLETTFDQFSAKLGSSIEAADLHSKLADSEARAYSANEANSKLELENARLKAELQDLNKTNKQTQETDTELRRLQDEVEALKLNKAKLLEASSALQSELTHKMSEFSQLETRMSSLEHRLNQSLIEKSRSILGSATMAVIDGAVDRSHTTPLLEAKRNISLSSDLGSEENRDQYSQLHIRKRGADHPDLNGPNARSVSLLEMGRVHV